MFWVCWQLPCISPSCLSANVSNGSNSGTLVSYGRVNECRLKQLTSSFRISKFLWLVVAIGIMIFYFLFDPADSVWMPQCIFHKVTGLQCMGCGTQRMAHALLHGDLQEAFRANAFLLVSLPFLAFLLFVELTRSRHPGLYARIHSQFTIITVSVILFVWFILRNLLGL